MEEGFDKVKGRVRDLTFKLKANQFPTAEGISYPETKHLLLLSYCQSFVDYLLRKAQGLSIDGHLVVHSLVEILLFLEKIRPIDKILQYQIQKLTTASTVSSENASVKENATNTSEKAFRKCRCQRKCYKYFQEGGGLIKIPPQFRYAHQQSGYEL